MAKTLYTSLQLRAAAEKERRSRSQSRSWPECHVQGKDGEPEPFHLGQQAAWESEAQTTAMIAGTQGGKTVFGPWWLAREIDRMGAGDYLAVTATYDLFKLRMLPSLLLVFEQLLRNGRYWAQDRLIEIRDPATGRFWAKRSTDPMYARIILRSADAKGGLEAATAKAAWEDEAGQDRFTLEAKRGIERRLSIHQGRELITTTLYNLAWVKTEVIDPAKEGGEVDLQVLPHGAELEITDNEDVGIRLIQYDSIVNPAFPIESYEKARRTAADDDFLMFWRGRVAKLRTLIYDCFDKVHQVDPFPIPGHWPRAVGVDPIGARIGVVWLAFDPESKRLYIYREYYAPFGETTAGHVREIRKLSRNEPIVRRCGGQPAERQPRTDWGGAGFPLEPPPFPGVWDGIERVYRLFKEYRMFVFKTCENFINEAGTYQRMRNRAGQVTDKIKDKDDYHLLDATRYIIALLMDPTETEEVIHIQVPTGPTY